MDARRREELSILPARGIFARPTSRITPARGAGTSSWSTSSEAETIGSFRCPTYSSVHGARSFPVRTNSPVVRPLHAPGDVVAGGQRDVLCDAVFASTTVSRAVRHPADERLRDDRAGWSSNPRAMVIPMPSVPRHTFRCSATMSKAVGANRLLPEAVVRSLFAGWKRRTPTILAAIEAGLRPSPGCCAAEGAEDARGSGIGCGRFAGCCSTPTRRTPGRSPIVSTMRSKRRDRSHGCFRPAPSLRPIATAVELADANGTSCAGRLARRSVVLPTPATMEVTGATF